MRLIQLDKTYVRHLSALALILLSTITSCKRAGPGSDSVQAAVDMLHTRLAGMEKHLNGTDSQRHSLEALQVALANLNGKTAADFNAPIPIAAELTGIYNLPGALSLKIQWLDPRAEADGLYIVDAQGHQMQFQGVIVRRPKPVRM